MLIYPSEESLLRASNFTVNTSNESWEKHLYDTPSMHEQIINLGWAWHGYCNCAMRGKIYRKGDYKLFHYFNNKLFWLGIKNKKIIQTTDDKLIEEIKNL